jgi:hypothetical protein
MEELYWVEKRYVVFNKVLLRLIHDRKLVHYLLGGLKNNIFVLKSLHHLPNLLVHYSKKYQMNVSMYMMDEHKKLLWDFVEEM